MKSLSIRLGLAAAVYWLAFLAPGCAPYVMSYDHLWFETQEGLVVLESSKASKDSQGNDLRFAKTGLPLKLKLARPNYSLHFDTPLGSIPLVFISARDEKGVALQITGPHVKHVAAGSASELEGYQYSFYVKEADDAPLSIEITDAAGTVLGTELLPYKIVSRGYTYGIDSI